MRSSTQTRGAPFEGASLVALKGVSFSYGSVQALVDVDLEIQAGERVALIGPSGAGKSTLLGICRGSIVPTSGRAEVLGRSLSELRGRELRRALTTIGAVHQQLHLVGPLRVVHNVNAGRLGTWPRSRALWSLIRPQGLVEVAAALERVGIADKLMERTDHLSGGEQQRVALARVLVQEPDVVLADEPIASLDPARGREVMELLRDVAAGASRALVVSLHAYELARSHCDRIVGLRAGRIVFDLPAADVTDVMAAGLYRIGRE